MSESYIRLTADNLEQEHLCCAIADKKHQAGIERKKAWLREQLPDGHVFYKLDARGKVFIEYAPVQTAWVPVEGDDYLYIHCLWVSGSFQGKGHARHLLDACLADAKRQGRAGVCVLSSDKKRPFLSDKKFFLRHGFVVADRTGDGYELLALSLDGTLPRFCDAARQCRIQDQALTIYYSPRCPYAADCIEQIKGYCAANSVPLQLVSVTSAAQAKAVPGPFNNWAVFLHGEFQTVHLLNEGFLKKLLQQA